MVYSDYFDPDKLFEKIIEMKPEECKAAMIGGIFGFGLACEMLEDQKEEKKHEQSEYKSLIDAPFTTRPRKTIKTPTNMDFRKIRLEFYDRDDAEEVLDDLRERLEGSREGRITVRVLYSLADLPTNREMFKWIWDDLEDCSIERYGDHYILKMPPARPIAS